jgi:hypothetical protein
MPGAQDENSLAQLVIVEWGTTTRMGAASNALKILPINVTI